MAMGWGIAIALGLLSVLWAELVRDGYHTLSHFWPPLYRQHLWHHKAFRTDLSIVDPQLYRKAQWHNDLPECLVMLACCLLFGWLMAPAAPQAPWLAYSGAVYTLSFLAGAIARGLGIPGAHDLTDLTHLPGPFQASPSHWLVNRTYHWRHHFDNQQAYYCGTFTLWDRLIGTALSLKGKTVTVTGASGSLGRALIHKLHRAGATVIALTSCGDSLTLSTAAGSLPIRTQQWCIGEEDQLLALLESTDILVINHGVNVHAERSPAAISQSYEVNAFSGLRLMELFLSTVSDNRAIARKEVWVNTSEAEVNPAFSPLYELSKRTLGDLVTLRRLDAPCVIRKLILGPFRSALNPIGVMSADWVAGQIIAQARRDFRNIIVTINPLTYLFFLPKEMLTSLYFRLCTRPIPAQQGAVSLPDAASIPVSEKV
jgi:monoglucosyldiacylglycerol epimerase